LQDTAALPDALVPVSQEQLAKPEPKPAAPSVLTPAERAKLESERIQAEAAKIQRADFITHLCGTGSTKPSGKAN
jgi:hypothetical protein